MSKCLPMYVGEARAVNQSASAKRQNRLQFWGVTPVYHAKEDR